MGQYTIPEEPLYGDDCLACFPAGKTPYVIKASFSGINDCWPDIPPDHVPIPETVILYQNEVIPCYWVGGVGDFWFASYECCDAGRSRLRLSYLAVSYFEDFILGCCKTHFTNDNVCGFGLWHGEGGIGCVSWVPDTTGPAIHKILSKLAISPDPKTLYEIRPITGNFNVIKFCNTLVPMRIHVKYNPDQI